MSAIAGYLSMDGFLRHNIESFKRWNEWKAAIEGCQPNAAHFAIATLVKQGTIQTIITQTVDTLLKVLWTGDGLTE